MLQKRTTYHCQLNTLPIASKLKAVESHKVDAKQLVSYLVFLDMLQLLKM